MESRPRIHVLAVDDDPLSLMVLQRMLLRCQYQVTTCTRVAAAVQLLRKYTDTLDLVMSDVYMPDADGFKLLEFVAVEMDLPVIMMSANGETSVVMRGITHGACDYLIKPIRMEELKTIRQHVVTRRKGTKDTSMMRSRAQLEGASASNIEDTMDIDFEPDHQHPVRNDTSIEEQYFDNTNIVNTVKKVARAKWAAPLHEKFVMAVNELGVNKLLWLSTTPSPTASDQPGSSMRAHPWQRSANMPFSMPARGLYPDVGSSSLARASTIDGGWMDAMDNSRPSVTQPRMAGNGAQECLGLINTSGSNPFSHSTIGNAAIIHRAASDSLVSSAASGTNMGGGSGGGGLFKMGSLDIGLLLEMQQEEEEMERLQKGNSCKDDMMEDLPSHLPNSSRNVVLTTPAGGQQPSQKLNAARPMLLMSVPSMISTAQQASGGVQASRRMGVPIDKTTPSHPCSDNEC